MIGRARRNWDLFKAWFEKKQGSGAPAPGSGLTGPRVPRHSGGWATLRKRLQAEPGLRVIDIGYTSPSNINHLTSRNSEFYGPPGPRCCERRLAEGHGQRRQSRLERGMFL